MEAIKENWITIKEAIRKEYNITDISFRTWIEPLEIYNIILNISNVSYQHPMDKVIHIMLITRVINHNAQGLCG